MQALVRANAGIEKGQWGRWSGSMGVAMGLRRAGSGQKGAWVVSSTLQGSKRYLTGL